MRLSDTLRRAAHYIFKGVPVNQTTAKVYITSYNTRFQGKNIIVTGGSRGLGKAIAKRICIEGGNVLITGTNKDTLSATASELGCQFILYNNKDCDQAMMFLREAETKLEATITGLVSNAGVSLHERSFRNVTIKGWDEQLDTNLKGNFFLVQAYVKYLEEHKANGTICVISSERSRRPDAIPYGISKIGTDTFIKSIAREVIAEGIRINGVAPGVTATDMTGFNEDGNLYADWQAGRRVFIPEEVAEVVTFLLSDSSACINGEIIACNQGRHIATW